MLLLTLLLVIIYACICTKDTSVDSGLYAKRLSQYMSFKKVSDKFEREIRDGKVKSITVSNHKDNTFFDKLRKWADASKEVTLFEKLTNDDDKSPKKLHKLFKLLQKEDSLCPFIEPKKYESYRPVRSKVYVLWSALNRSYLKVSYHHDVQNRLPIYVIHEGKVYRTQREYTRTFRPSLFFVTENDKFTTYDEILTSISNEIIESITGGIFEISGDDVGKLEALASKILERKMITKEDMEAYPKDSVIDRHNKARLDTGTGTDAENYEPLCRREILNVYRIALESKNLPKDPYHKSKTITISGDRGKLGNILDFELAWCTRDIKKDVEIIVAKPLENVFLEANYFVVDDNLALVLTPFYHLNRELNANYLRSIVEHNSHTIVSLTDNDLSLPYVDQCKELESTKNALEKQKSEYVTKIALLLAEEHHINRYQYDWVDKSVVDVSALIDFIKLEILHIGPQTKSFFSLFRAKPKTNEQSFIYVHCMGGYGRTGTFAAITKLVSLASKKKYIFDGLNQKSDLKAIESRCETVLNMVLAQCRWSRAETVETLGQINMIR